MMSLEDIFWTWSIDFKLDWLCWLIGFLFELFHPNEFTAGYHEAWPVEITMATARVMPFYGAATGFDFWWHHHSSPFLSLSPQIHKNQLSSAIIHCMWILFEGACSFYAFAIGQRSAWKISVHVNIWGYNSNCCFVFSLPSWKEN